MGMTAKITSKGQTTLPAEARAILGVKPGDRVRYVPLEDGSLKVEKLEDSLSSLWGILKTDVRLSDEELRQAIEDAREAMALGLDRD